MKVKSFLCTGMLFIPLMIFAQIFEYPVAKKEIVQDTLYDKVIIDEYRWLEKIRSDETLSWVTEQSDLTKKAMKKLAFKGNSFLAIKKYAKTRYSNPLRLGDYYFTFSYKNYGGTSSLYCRSSLRGIPYELVNPQFISSKDNVSIESVNVSNDSKLLAYEFSRNGSDAREIKVVNIKTGNHLQDHLFNTLINSSEWKGNGFYYSKYSNDSLCESKCRTLYYHKLGTLQKEDQIIFRRTNNPNSYFSSYVTPDERYLIIHEDDDMSGLGNIFFIDFNDPVPSLKPLITRLSSEDDILIFGNIEEQLIALNYKNANNGMIVKIDPKSPREWVPLIPSYKSSVLLDATLLDDRIIVQYQTNDHHEVVIFNFEGEVLHSMIFPVGTTVAGFYGEKDDKEISFSIESYTMPKTVYIMDVHSFETEALMATTVSFDYSQFEIKSMEYESFDGVSVPLLIMYKKDLELKNQNPTLLKAYGGYGSISQARFSPGIVHFLKHGGIFVFAHIRGGGNKGKEWHLDGKGANKKNSYEDFIAAANFLIDNNYTSPEKLAITGASHGGLVISAAMVRRPELFKVAVPIVAPLDMMRYETHVRGNYNRKEYGSVLDSIGFFNLLEYSPLQNIKEGVNYPCTLIMTSENDDRVPPFHSYKFAAKLQGRAAQKNPILLRVEEDSGHYGATKNYTAYLKEESSKYDFILYHLGMN